MNGIVIPVYANTQERLKYFQYCVQSIKRQDKPFVAIFVDDESPFFSDVQSIIGNDERFRLVQRQRHPTDLKTASNALNYGIDLILDSNQKVLGSTENIHTLSYVHSDDMLSLHGLQTQKPKLFSYTDMIVINEENRVLLRREAEKKPNISAKSFPHHSSSWSFDFMNRLREYILTKYNQDGVFDPSISYGEDRDVSLSSLELLSILNEDAEFVHFPRYFYRVHEKSITGEIVPDHKEGDIQKVNEKHNLKNYSQNYFQKIFANFPWSLGTNLPEHIKKKIRPIRQKIYLVTKRQTLVDVIKNDSLVRL